MYFNKFIIVVLIWCGYYLIVIIYDYLKTLKHLTEINTNHLQFITENPNVINGKSDYNTHLRNIDARFYSGREYMTVGNPNDLENPDEKNSLLADLGLETISGDAYTLSAENLSKFMFH
ncbi:MAG: hypothetical protein ABI168_11355 [Ginsengibacter sp.]